MKTYWGSSSIAPRILGLGIRWRWVVRFTPRPLYPQGKNPWYPSDRRMVGPRAVLDTVVKRKIHSPRRGSNPRTPIVQPVTQRYTEELRICMCAAHPASSVFCFLPAHWMDIKKLVKLQTAFSTKAGFLPIHCLQRLSKRKQTSEWWYTVNKTWGSTSYLGTNPLEYPKTWIQIVIAYTHMRYPNGKVKAVPVYLLHGAGYSLTSW
jgi:hypothetical protein